jgi:hypothetical protein
MMEVLKSLTDPRNLISDSGPWYHEFHADAFIKEPWNAYSSLFFLVPVIFWFWKLRGQYCEYLIITLLLPLLFLNGIGSTLYHAFRSSQLMLLLDWLPASLMNLILVYYLWYKLIYKKALAVFMVLAFYAVAFLVMNFLGSSLGDLAINISYLLVGLALIIPFIIYLKRTHFKNGYLVLLTFIFLGLALLFRTLDYPTSNPWPSLLPMGTHFLWHITSSLAVFTLGFYFFFDQKIKA